MSCFVPFNNKNLELTFFVFRPTVANLDVFLDSLKYFSSCTETLGCVQHSIFKSIHGNLIIWYGAWSKKSAKNKEYLSAVLLSMLKHTSSMAVLVDYSFSDPYAGESRDGITAAKFSTGDIISMTLLTMDSKDMNGICYTNLALFKSSFARMEGIKYGVCFKIEHPSSKVASFYVWSSLHACYSWVFDTDIRKEMMAYVEQFCQEMKYDMFRVVYVKSDNVRTYQIPKPTQVLHLGTETETERRETIMSD